MFIFITGYYDTIPNAIGLHQYLGGVWAAKGLRPDRFFRYDQLAEAVAFVLTVPVAEPLAIVGFSWGGDAAVRTTAALAGRGVSVLALIDPVHYPNPKPDDPGFDLPDNVSSAYCWYRTVRQSFWSVPIRSGRCEFTNAKFNPTPGQSEASAHGEPCRKPDAIIPILRKALGR